MRRAFRMLLIGSGIAIALYCATTAYPFREPKTISELRESSPGDGAETTLLGYRDSGDGGGGRFYFDGTSIADDNGGTVIKSRRSVGRWLRPRAGLINVRWFGARGDAHSNDTGAIQSAIDVAANSGASVYVPAGVYRVVPETKTTDEGGEVTIAFLMRSNMTIRAEPGATLKLADHQSTKNRPKTLGMFFSNQPLHSIHFLDLSIDMNGENNLISPDPEGGRFNRYNQSHISFSGTIASVAARGDDITIERCRFIGTAGTNCIVMAQSNMPGAILGKRWTIKQCVFLNNGCDTNDHTSIYGWADDVLIDSNVFTAEHMVKLNGVGGIRAHEVHGARHRFIQNIVQNYYQAVYICSNFTSPASDIIIQGNICSPLRGIAFDFFRESELETDINRVVIAGNTVLLTDDVTFAKPKAVVQIATSYPVRDVLIIGNVASKAESNILSVFGSLNGRKTLSSRHERISFIGNHSAGTTDGILITSASACGWGPISIKDNVFSELEGPSGSLSAGISVGGHFGVLDAIDIANNTIDKAAYGIYVDADVTSLNLAGNFFTRIGTANYFNSKTPSLNFRDSTKN